jgi:hypothetical protein
MNNTKLEFAQMFQKQGISVIPLRHRGKEPDLIGTWERYKTILSTSEEVRNWLHSDWQNYGVVAGWKNLAFIDFDDMNTFALWFDWFALLNKHAEVYPTPYIVRSARGAHVYISCPTLAANEKRRGVDVKCHGYVVGPGCLHPSGTEYAPVTEFRLIDVFDLDTFLPLDLFPKIAPERSCGQIGVFDGVLSTGDYGAVVEDYDPYQMAMFSGQKDLSTTVKQRVRIESMFASLRPTSADGRWLVTLCPFHDDHNPSMWIDTRRQLCGCATCGMKPMDAINLFARMHNISESAAVSAMAKELGVWG